MKKEIYRSFEGTLNADTRYGYIIYDMGDLLEIESLSAEMDVQDNYFRIPKSLLPADKYGDLALIGELHQAADDGVYDDAQTMWHDKWYKGSTIRKIQDSNRDYYWRRHV